MASKSSKKRSKNDAKKIIKKSALNKFGMRCRTALGGPLEYNYTPVPRDRAVGPIYIYIYICIYVYVPKMTTR